MSAIAAALRRAGGLLVEPVPSPPPGRAAPLDVVVTPLAARAGATTVSRGLAQALATVRTVEVAAGGGPGEVAAGPGTAVVRDTPPADAGRMSHHGPGRVLVVVADGRREPPLAAIVRDVLARRHERVVLVANRARDVQGWAGHGAVCVPESRLGAWLVGQGPRLAGTMRDAFAAVAVAVEEAAEEPATVQNS